MLSSLTASWNMMLVEILMFPCNVIIRHRECTHLGEGNGNIYPRCLLPVKDLMQIDFDDIRSIKAIVLVCYVVLAAASLSCSIIDAFSITQSYALSSSTTSVGFLQRFPMLRLMGLLQGPVMQPSRSFNSALKRSA